MADETRAPQGNGSDVKQSLSGLEAAIEKINKGLPALPDSAKEGLVKALPWIIIIVAIISIPAALAIFGLGSIFGALSFYGGVYGGTVYYVTSILALIVFVMELIAVPGLLKRTKAAWNLLFYGALITALSNLISFSIASLIIGILIEFYLLFQIRSYYK